jgi:hypothetical protein
MSDRLPRVEPAAYEAWGRAVVEDAAARIVAEIPTEQRPETGKTSRAVSAGRGYISRYVHFRHPAYPAQRAVWLFAVPAGHAYDFAPPHDRVGAGLMQDANAELDPSRFAAGLTRSGAFAWKTHIDARYEGYRLAISVDPDSDAPESVAAELASQVLHGLRRAGLIGGGGAG